MFDNKILIYLLMKVLWVRAGSFDIFLWILLFRVNLEVVFEVDCGVIRGQSWEEYIFEIDLRKFSFELGFKSSFGYFWSFGMESHFTYAKS